MDSERMNKLDAILFALSLEVALLHMRIVGYYNNDIFNNDILFGPESSAKVHCAIYGEMSKTIFAEKSSELRVRDWNLYSKNARLQREKLVRDREMVNDVIRRTLIEVAEDSEWPTMQQAIAGSQQRESSAMSRRMQYEELFKKRQSIVEELETKRRLWVQELRKADHTMAVLRDKINDDQLNANVRLTYVEKWIVARAESLQLQYNQPRPPLPRIDHEERVHKELLKAYDMQIKEREESLNYWQDRFTTDTVNMNARLAAKCEQLREAKTRREELQKLFNLHEGEIRAWLTFKRERAARLAREERQREAATKIQSWWRGVMVRHALGSFRYLKNIKKTPTKKKK